MKSSDEGVRRKVLRGKIAACWYDHGWIVIRNAIECEFRRDPNKAGFPEAFGYEYIFPGASHLAEGIIIIRDRYEGFYKIESAGGKSWPERLALSCNSIRLRAGSRYYRPRFLTAGGMFGRRRRLKNKERVLTQL
jgi:hypothetical protein